LNYSTGNFFSAIAQGTVSLKTVNNLRERESIWQTMAKRIAEAQIPELPSQRAGGRYCTAAGQPKARA
jgi:hypothetical protein